MKFHKIYDTTKEDEKELIIAEVIKPHFKISTLTKTKRFHSLDFIDENNIYYEIKGRNCEHDKYPTTMINIRRFATVWKWSH